MIPTNLDCTAARPHLALHAGGDLESALAEQVEAHLNGCAACRAELGRAQVARERIAVLAQVGQGGLESVDLWPALRQRLDSERESSSAPRPGSAPRRASSRLRRVGWLSLPLAAAAALLLMFNRGEAPRVDPAGSPAAPLPSATLATSLDVEATPASPGGLRRAAPGEERLRDTARPLDRAPRGLLRGAAPGPTHSLAADDGLR